MILIILFVLATALLVISEYGWTGGLYYTIAVGFLQDPIRKLAGPTGSTLYGGLAFACFILTFWILKNRHKYWYAIYLFWTNQNLIALLTAFYYFIGLQALNSFARIGDIRLTIVGILFYTLPFLALWVGFHVGIDSKLVRTLLKFYVICCSVFAVSVLLSAQGIDNPLFSEVGGGLDITGIGTGNSGLWRTTEIAGWHLAAGACFSFILGMSSKNTFQQNLYFFLSIGLTFLSTTTGRRKAIGIVIVFVALFLLYYSLSSQKSRVFRIATSLLLVCVLASSIYGLLFSEATQVNLDRFEERTSTLTLEESKNRFGGQGVGALVRAFEIAGPFGFGVGIGSNVGNTGIDISVLGQRSIGFVSEGGGGRIVAELGVFGAIFFLVLVLQIVILYVRNFKVGLVSIPPDEFNVLVGMLLFVVANIVTFFTAAQLYSDLFVLIIIGISFGSFLSVPLIASKYSHSTLTSTPYP